MRKKNSRVIFLDRDGTLNVDKNYLYKKEEFQWIPGVLEALHIFQNIGFKLIVITNQSGIGRGYYTEKDFQILNTWMVTELQKQYVFIDKVYYCPHYADSKIKKYGIDCNCRKPKLGLFEQAIQDFNVELSLSYTVGDKLRDLSLCTDTPCRGFLIGDKESKKIIDDVKSCEFRNLFYEENLLLCAKKIELFERKRAITYINNWL